jgi:two-component system, OmpR family, alkaline phosphatase synthesis response regulator PhoP
MTHANDRTILVVEDEPDVRMFLEACAEDAGFNVHTAEDGQNALDQLASLTPDLITLDMVMPRMNGLAFLRKLRDHPPWQKIPVILITAHLRDDLGEEALRQLLAFPPDHRPAQVLEKPINPPELVRLIAKLLDVAIDDEDIGLATHQRSITSRVRNRDTEILRAINLRLKTE